MKDLGPLPKEFFQSCSEDEANEIMQTGFVTGEALQRLWRMLEYQGPLPDKVAVFVERKSLDKFLKTLKRRE